MMKSAISVVAVGVIGSALTAGALWAAPSPTWCGTKLNGLAVKDDGGNVVVLGMAGAYNNGANTKEKVFDGNVNTFISMKSLSMIQRRIVFAPVARRRSRHGTKSVPSSRMP